MNYISGYAISSREGKSVQKVKEGGNSESIENWRKMTCSLKTYTEIFDETCKNMTFLDSFEYIFWQ